MELLDANGYKQAVCKSLTIKCAVFSCPLDKHLLPNLSYGPNTMMAVAEAHVFKFADRPQLYFQCQVSLCVDLEGGCVDYVSLNSRQLPESGSVQGNSGNRAGISTKKLWKKSQKIVQKSLIFVFFSHPFALILLPDLAEAFNTPGFDLKSTQLTLFRSSFQIADQSDLDYQLGPPPDQSEAAEKWSRFKPSPPSTP